MTDVAVYTHRSIFCSPPQDAIPFLCAVQKLLMPKSQFLVALNWHNVAAP